MCMRVWDVCVCMYLFYLSALLACDTSLILSRSLAGFLSARSVAIPRLQHPSLLGANSRADCFINLGMATSLREDKPLKHSIEICHLSHPTHAERWDKHTHTHTYIYIYIYINVM